MCGGRWKRPLKCKGAVSALRSGSLLARFAIHQFREETERGAGRVAAIRSASTDREDVLRDRNSDWRRDRVRSESRFGRLKQVDGTAAMGDIGVSSVRTT